MIESFQNDHAARDPEAREWIECGLFAIAVPAAYIAAVAIAVSVAMIAPEDSNPETAAEVHAAAQ